MVAKLELALQLARNEENQAAQIFQSAQIEASRAESDLDRALKYRDEYFEMSEGLRPSNFASQQLKAARLFLERINFLVSQQRELVAAKITSAESYKASWQEARAKRKGVERFIEKREANKSIADDKKEQKLLDDLFLAGRSE